MPSKKPYAEACDENGKPILDVLTARLPESCSVLEIGSGTGQHAVFFGKAMPGVIWQTSDRKEMHEGILMWIEEAKLANVLPPLELDVLSEDWPATRYDAVFSANTAHIMPMEAVEAMFHGVGKLLQPTGRFFLYGPFMYGGKHTSDSNHRFDRWIRSWESHRGVRDVDWLRKVAEAAGLELEEDVEMPANNRTLIWRRV